jgi:F-type H+-transporting ATPase subunit gamma
MPSLKVVRKRIASVKSTQKITRAMKMVAGARLNRAQQRIVALRPYAQKTGEVLRSVAASMATPDIAAEAGEEAPAPDDRQHPLLARRPEKNVLYIVVTSDRGLCGAINTNVAKAVERDWKAKEAEGKTVHFVTIGRKGREYLQRRRGHVVYDVQKPFDALDLDKARGMASWFVTRYEKGEYDSVYLVYNEFKSAITQKVNMDQLLPLAAPESTGAAEQEKTGIIFEPTPEALLYRLLPMYMEITLLRALLDSQASFFGAQMTAMDAATRNAKDMIQRLTLVYNRARQAAITKELMEIIGGAEALKD